MRERREGGIDKRGEMTEERCGMRDGRGEGERERE